MNNTSEVAEALVPSAEPMLAEGTNPGIMLADGISPVGDCSAPQAETSAANETADEESSIPRALDLRERQTVRLDLRDLKPSWPIAISLLEQLSCWPVFALRLGTLALIQECVRELAEEDARADLIVQLRALTDALAHMPLEE